MEVLTSRAIGARAALLPGNVYRESTLLISPDSWGLIAVKILFKPSIG